MMKKLFLVFTVLFSINSYAQLTIGADSVYAVYDTTEEEPAVYNTQSTTTPTDTMKWEIISVEVPSGWINDIKVCDFVCYDENTNSNEYILLDSKQIALDVHFLNSQMTGEGKAKLLVWDINDSLNTVKTVTYVINVEEPSAIIGTENIDVSIFPNPVSKFININNVDISAIDKIEIYNVIGKQVYFNHDISLNNNIDFNAFDKGVYILKLIGSDNNIVYTKNIIKK